MKVLLISHNPISTSNNMGKTFLSLFSSFRIDEISQFYVHPSLPDVVRCNSYYRLTDKNIIKGILRFSAYGKIIDCKEIDLNKKSSNTVDTVKSATKKNPFRYLLRDMVWGVSRWYTKKLKKWIVLQKPDVIFLAPGYAKFIYNVAIKISKEYKLPIVTYICDDFYFVNNKGSLISRLQVGLLKRKISRLMKFTNEIISICDEIKDSYEKKFHVHCMTLMTGSSFNVDEAQKYYNEKIYDKTALVYLGNVRCNRYKSLRQIGYALEQINEQNNADYRLKIYTSEKDESILGCLNEVKTIEICGYVSSEEFLQTLCSAEVLVHTESFDESMVDLVKHSVSTKIADSLASGRKFFAYGPENVASISYLKNNGLAYVATDEDELKDILYQCLTESGEQIIDKAKAFAKTNHDSERNSILLHDELQKIIENEVE